MATTEPPAETPADRRQRADQLRAELAELEPQSGARRTGAWRTFIATLLIVAMAILAPLAVVARWAHDEVSDTDRYVSTVAPLAHDPAVQRAVADRITTEIVSRLDVRQVTDQAVGALSQRGLPPLAATSLQALSGPLANAIQDFISRQVTAIVQSDAFSQAWEQANREAHTQMVAVLTGKGSDTVDVSNGVVSINLATIIETVKTRLVDRGFTLVEKLPDVQAQFTVFQSADLEKAQTGFRLLSAVNTLLPILALVCLIGAVLVGRSRRRTLVAGAITLAASMLLLGVALNAFRSVYLDAVPADQLPADAAGAIYDQLAWFIRLNLRAILVLSLAVAFIAWVSGPSRTAVTVRRGTSGMIEVVRGGTARAGLDTGRLGVALDSYRNAIRGVVLGGALLVYVMRDHPTGAFTLVLLAVAAVILLLVELLARPAAPEASPSASAPTGPQ
ncbi:hypothetical protein [Nocardioides sp. CER19]|uniref:hypothetical protein n=1 Tax=Nocardioides sp. CER19 TaxID=3038538 RepID=UPI00244A0A61|nr:hypothetical protein [Nocardioides sp. CER19]MDH2416011.1 hypothetical protein [Nocardioides sp. CER19]